MKFYQSFMAISSQLAMFWKMDGFPENSTQALND